MNNCVHSDSKTGTSKLIQNLFVLTILFYKSSGMHSLLVSWYNKPTWDIGRTLTKLVNHKLEVNDLQDFLLFA